MTCSYVFNPLGKGSETKVKRLLSMDDLWKLLSLLYIHNLNMAWLSNWSDSIFLKKKAIGPSPHFDK